MQGELRVPIDLALIDAVPLDQPGLTPLGGTFPPILGLPTCADPNRCEVDLRMDLCRRIDSPICTLGDVIPVDLDAEAPPAVQTGDLQIEDTDTNDGVIDRICVEGDEDDVVILEIRGDDGTVREVILDPSDPNVTRESLGGGRVRLCRTAVPLPPSSGDGPRSYRITTRRRDGSGNEGPSTGFSLECEAPPRKHVGFDGRRSAMALDRNGFPHVIYTDGPRVAYARWDVAQDLWIEQTVACLCRDPADQNVCPADCARDAPGLTVDITISPDDEPVMCYTRTRFDSGVVAVPPGWELTTDAEVHVARVSSGALTDTILETTSARNLGCAIESRRGRLSSSPSPDYLLAFSSSRDAPLLHLDLLYVADAAGGGVAAVPHGGSVAALRAMRAAVGDGGVARDVAVDAEGAFWIAAEGTDGRLALLGELADGVGGEPGFGAGGERREHRLVGPVVLPGVGSTGARPRVAARGPGEVAVVWTDLLRGPLFAVRGPADGGELAGRQVAPLRDVPALAAGAREPETPELTNVGRLASIDDLFTGIPASIAFAPGELLPRIAWAAASPAGTDYHVLLHAVPAQGDLEERYHVDVIDGRVEASANVQLVTSPIGRSRILYHNGLGVRRVASPSPVDECARPAPEVAPRTHGIGSLQFWRQEDEDELFPDPNLQGARRGDLRCFAERLFSHDDDSGNPHVPGAALDDAFAALTPRPALDLDPCGRTTDSGFELELTYRLAQINARLAYGGCTDGLDNDCDGAADCADPECADVPTCPVACTPTGATETRCDDRTDDDCDGAPDCLDADCAADPACAGVTCEPTGSERGTAIVPIPSGFDPAGDMLRPPSLFARLPGESNLAFADRTNDYRETAFHLLRQLIGDLRFLDSVFPRNDNLSWNSVTPDPVVGDELFDDGSARAGSLDAVFLMLGEAFEDFCGLDGVPRQACTGDGSETLRPTTDDCTMLGRRERNPNPLFPGVFSRGGPTDTTDAFYTHDPFRADAPAYEATFSAPGAPSYGDSAVSRAGLLQDAIINLRTGGDPASGSPPGVYRRMEHVCIPADRQECLLGVPAISPREITLAALSRTVAVTGSMAEGACPYLRSGARLRYPDVFAERTAAADPQALAYLLGGVPLVNPVPCQAADDPVGCCTGYAPRACTRDAECWPHPQRDGNLPWRCESGYCQSPRGGEVCDTDADCPPVLDESESTPPHLPCLLGRCLPSDCQPRLFDDLFVGWTCSADTFHYLCYPEVCTSTEPMYCTPSPPDPSTAAIRDTLCDASGPEAERCRTAISNLNGPGALPALNAPLSIAEGMVRGGDCPPSAVCAPTPADRGPAALLRPFVGHHAVRLGALAGLTGAAGAGTADAAFAAGNPVREIVETLAAALGSIGSLPIHERRIADVEVSWRESFDGDLALQGHLVVQATLDPPDIRSLSELGGVPGFHIQPFVLRVRLAPYFFAEPPLLGTCDGCERRRPDSTIHFRVVEAGFFRAADPTVPLGAGDVGGCSCFGDEVELASCLLGCGCEDFEIGGRRITDIDDLPGVLQTLVTGIVTDSEPIVDDAFHLATTDPLVGGVLLGRLAAVEDLVDAVGCNPGPRVDTLRGSAPPPEPAVVNRDCSAPVRPGAATGADTIEVLRIRPSDGRVVADVVGRDNPLRSR